MIIKNKSLLKSFRTQGLCEFCRELCKKKEPCHVISRGAGGSDIRVNLVSLGSTVQRCCPCHTHSHNGLRPTRDDLLVIVAKRESCRPEDVLAVLRFVQRLDKVASRYRIQEALLGLTAVQKKIAQRELEEASRL